jgi:hypothetical protein
MRFLAATLLSVLLAGLGLPCCPAAASRMFAGGAAGAPGADCRMTCCKRHAPQAPCARGWNCGRQAHSAIAPPLASLPAAVPGVTAPPQAARTVRYAALPTPYPARDLPEHPPRA